MWGKGLVVKWAKDVTDIFPEKIYTNRQQVHTKRCSTSLLIREMQNQNHTRHHRTPVSMAIIKKNRNNKCWKGCGILCWWKFPAGGNGSCCSHYGKQYQLKKNKLELLYDPAILSVYLKEKKTLI